MNDLKTENQFIEAALAETNEKYRELVERANDGICIAQDGKVVFANRSLQDMLGYTEDEMIGASFLDYIQPEERDRIREMNKQRMQGMEVPTIFTVPAVRKNGQKIIV